MAQISTSRAHSALACHAPRHGGVWRVLTALLGLQRSRNRLKSLEPRMLRDIGVTLQEANREADKPVWDVPAHWKS